MNRSGVAVGVVAALAMATAATTAWAQGSGPGPAEPRGEPTPAANEATVVQGVTVTAHRRPPVKDMPAAIHDFVRSHGTPTRRIDQIPRWEDRRPICVATLGLDPEFNAFITRRVQEVAVKVGAPVAKPKPGKPCEPNIEIIFSDDPQGVAKSIFKHNDELMGYHFAPNVPRLSQFDPPIKAWYLTGTRGGGNAFAIDSIWVQQVSGALGSRLTTGLQSEFVNILVLANVKDLLGHEIGPISDYVTMLVLTQPRSLKSCDPLPSILDLLAPTCSDADKPSSLTREDLAYLRALYSVYGGQAGTLEYQDIWGRMKQELAKP